MTIQNLNLQERKFKWKRRESFVSTQYFSCSYKSFEDRRWFQVANKHHFGKCSFSSIIVLRLRGFRSFYPLLVGACGCPYLHGSANSSSCILNLCISYFCTCALPPHCIFQESKENTADFIWYILSLFGQGQNDCGDY